MSERRRYDPQISPVIQRATAAPVDTYARPGPTQEEQLAQALASVQPSLSNLSQGLSTDIAQSKRAEGEQAARVHSENALKAGDMTRDGTLPMQDNPYFMAGYKEETGRVAAGVWQSDFKASEAQDPVLRDSINMADFDKAVGSHISKWFADKGFERDPAFEKGFGHMKDQYVAMARLGFAEGIEKKLDKRSDEALFSMVKRSITDNWGNENVTPDDVAKDIDLLTNSAVLRGRQDPKAKSTAAMAIAAAAKEMGPEKGLEVLKLFGLASGEKGNGKLKDQSYGAKALEETRKDLVLEGQQDAERQRKQKQWAKEQQVEDISSGALKLLTANPNANLEKFLNENQGAPPETVGALRSLQTQFQDLSYTTNKDVYNDLFNRVYDPQDGEQGTTVQEVVSKARNRNLRPEDAERLITMLETVRSRKERDPLEEKAKFYWEQEYRLMETAWKDKIGNFVPRENEFRVRNSRSILKKEWLDLKDSGKAAEMSPDEMSQWFINTGDKIIKQQQSQLQGDLKFSPPKSPDISAQGKTAKVEPLPPKLLLKPADFRAFSSGNTQSVERAMRQSGIPPDRMRDFVMDQARLNAEHHTPATP